MDWLSLGMQLFAAIDKTLKVMVVVITTYWVSASCFIMDTITNSKEGSCYWLIGLRTSYNHMRFNFQMDVIDCYPVFN